MKLDLKPAGGADRAAEGWLLVKHDPDTGRCLEALIPGDTAEPVQVALVSYVSTSLPPYVVAEGTYESLTKQLDVVLDLLTAARRCEWHRAVPA